MINILKKPCSSIRLTYMSKIKGCLKSQRSVILVVRGEVLCQSESFQENHPEKRL